MSNGATCSVVNVKLPRLCSPVTPSTLLNCAFMSVPMIGAHRAEVAANNSVIHPTIVRIVLSQRSRGARPRLGQGGKYSATNSSLKGPRSILHAATRPRKPLGTGMKPLIQHFGKRRL
eukprot:5951351-Pyramimonas_sp.AAC.2